MIQGTWGVGALLANLVNIPLVAYLPPNVAWRVACSLGAVAGVFTLIARKSLPESPRWLLSKGRIQEAEEIVSEIERLCLQPENGQDSEKTSIPHQETRNFFQQCIQLATKYPFRTLFACTLDLSQAFGGYGITNFLTLAILPGIISNQDVPQFYAISSLATFPGVAIAALLIDTIGRKKLLPLAYLTTSISVLLLFRHFFLDLWHGLLQQTL